MNNIKGILFDKDGTLLDNNLLWGAVGFAIADSVTGRFGLSPDSRTAILRAVGFDATGTVLLPNSALASGTATEITQAVSRALSACPIADEASAELRGLIVATIERAILQNAALIRPIGAVRHTLSALKEEGMKIGLATADLYSTTMICLTQLGIQDLFDYIGTDDGKTRAKPHPELLFNFCRLCGLSPDEVAVVGDSIADMEMGVNAGAALKVALVPGRDDKKPTAKSADRVIETVEELLPLF